MRHQIVVVWAWCFAFVLTSAFAQTRASPLPLTEQEMAYVQSHPTVRMCVDPDWTPFEHLDAQGQHIGIAADLAQLVAQRTGLRLEPLRVASWEESLEASKTGRCQVMSFLNETPQRQVWLDFTAPIFSDANVLITREEHPFIADLSIIEGQTIALPRGTMVEERIRKDFPLLKVVTTANEGEAMEMVSTRQADMTLRSLIVAAYTIKREGLFNLKIAGQVPEYANALRMGVVKGEPLLLRVLDKGVRSISPQEREAISNRHAAVQVQQGVDSRLLWQVAAVASALLLVAGFWHRKLRLLDRERAALAEARVEQALNVQREQSQLVALLSHEVRTALSMIDGAAGSLRLLLSPDDRTSQVRLERIHAGVQRLLDLTDQFLTKDRLESGALVPKLATVDALVLCQELVTTLDEERRVNVRASGNTTLQADPDLLQVAVRNLLVNALRYTPVHSPVTLEVVDELSHVTLRVIDQGPGISDEEKDAIFGRYVRGAQGFGKHGSGLGLHLVRRVASLHGGAVELESQQGQGACFALRLPRRG